MNISIFWKGAGPPPVWSPWGSAVRLVQKQVSLGWAIDPAPSLKGVSPWQLQQGSLSGPLHFSRKVRSLNFPGKLLNLTFSHPTLKVGPTKGTQALKVTM